MAGHMVTYSVRLRLLSASPYGTAILSQCTWWYANVGHQEVQFYLATCYHLQMIITERQAGQLCTDVDRSVTHVTSIGGKGLQDSPKLVIQQGYCYPLIGFWIGTHSVGKPKPTGLWMTLLDWKVQVFCYRPGPKQRLTPRVASRDTPGESSKGMPQVKVRLLTFHRTMVLRMP